MPIRGYVSDFERFLGDLKDKDPQIEEGQKTGRSILWDKDVDLEAIRRYGASRVPQPAYVYQTYVGGTPPGTAGSNRES
jgi:hypothetical protein